MSDAREIIAQHLCEKAGQGWPEVTAYERASYRTTAHGMIEALTSAGIRIIGPDEIDQVTDEMVEAASCEYMRIFGKHLLSKHTRLILTAAHEAGKPSGEEYQLPGDNSEQAVTDEMVERACRAYNEYHYGKGCPVWEEEHPPMRAALVAALQRRE